MPLLPSTRSSWPVLMVVEADPVPVTAGRPYSRQTIAAWLIMPPMSVTVALILPKIGPQRRRGDGGDQDLALLHLGELVGVGDHAGQALDDARARRPCRAIRRPRRRVAGAQPLLDLLGGDALEHQGEGLGDRLPAACSAPAAGGRS